MFPLEKRKLIRGAEAHVKAGLGIGADYLANYIPFHIPFDGVISTYWGTEGGNWLRLTRPNGDKIELAHLSKYQIRSGNAVAGQIGGLTGNTGAITTRPHLHIQIFNKAGQRLDPEKYIWGKGNMAQIKTQGKGASRRIVLEAENMNEWNVLCKIYGKDPNQLEEKV